MGQFIPPSFNLPLAWSVDFTYQRLLKIYQNIEEIEILPKDKKKLRQLRKNRMIFCINHPSQAESFVAYHIANVMGSRFHYMASRQFFEQAFGMVGRFIQGLGAFSVSGGSYNRSTLRTATKILAKDGGKLLLFPEGELPGGENDSLLPFQTAMFHLGFRALEQARAEDLNADITILPAFVKYVYPGSEPKIKGDLHQSIGRLEEHFGIEASNKNILSRFLSIGRAILKSAEEEYDIKVSSRKDFDYRVLCVGNEILNRLARKLNVPHFNYEADGVQKLIRLQTILESAALAEKSPLESSGKIFTLSPEGRKWGERECQKAYNFLMVKPEYLISRPTAERFYEWLYLYENYLFGSSKHRNRRAIVTLGEPFTLSDHLASYKKNRREVKAVLSNKLRNEMKDLLERSLELTMPIVRPYDVGEDLM